jgi:hypothetical protein
VLHPSDDNEAGQQTTARYRAVVVAECQNIQATGVFSNLAGYEVKYFSTTLDGAESYAAQASIAFGEGPYGIVKTSLRTAFITADMICSVDQGAIPTVTVPSELLPELDPPEIVRLR